MQSFGISNSSDVVPAANSLTPTTDDAFKMVLGYNSLIAGTDLINSRHMASDRPLITDHAARLEALRIRRWQLWVVTRIWRRLFTAPLCRPARRRRGKSNVKTENYRDFATFSPSLLSVLNTTRNLLCGMRVNQPRRRHAEIFFEKNAQKDSRTTKTECHQI